MPRFYSFDECHAAIGVYYRDADFSITPSPERARRSYAIASFEMIVAIIFRATLLR